MALYKTSNVKFSNLKFNELKSVVENSTQVTLNSHQMWLLILMMKLLITNIQASRICKAFENDSSANIKLSKI